MTSDLPQPALDLPARWASAARLLQAVGSVQAAACLVVLLLRHRAVEQTPGPGGEAISLTAGAALWWLQASLAAGITACICGLVMSVIGSRSGIIALWTALILAVIQSLFFASLAILIAGAAGRTNDPKMMSLGILLFGTIACGHIFVARRLWEVRLHPAEPTSKRIGRERP